MSTEFHGISQQTITIQVSEPDPAYSNAAEAAKRNRQTTSQISAYVQDGLALNLYNEENNRWMLTHVASGLGVALHAKKLPQSQALAWLEYACSLADWTQAWDTLCTSNFIAETLGPIATWQPSQK